MKQSTQNYLKTIFMLAYPDFEKAVRVSDIAQRLDISAPAVTEKLKRLADNDYLNHKRYAGVLLTEKGLSVGRNMVRHHRLWESFLTTVIGLSWDEVHDEAERLEHACSDKLINRIEEMMNYPKFDPHGNPIPSRDGVMPCVNDMQKLSDASKNVPCTVMRVVDFDQKFLSYLTELGVCLQNVIILLDHLEFDDTFLCEVDSQRITLSRRAAEHIFVQTES